MERTPSMELTPSNSVHHQSIEWHYKYLLFVMHQNRFIALFLQCLEYECKRLIRLVISFCHKPKHLPPSRELLRNCKDIKIQFLLPRPVQEIHLSERAELPRLLRERHSALCVKPLRNTKGIIKGKV